MRKSEEDWGVYIHGDDQGLDYLGAEKEGDDEYGGGTTRPPPDKKP